MDVALIILLGAAAPFFIAIINRVNWSSTTKQLVAWGTSIVLATVWLLLTGGVGVLTFNGFIAAVPVIYALSQAVYEFLLKNVLSKIEAATDRGALIVTPVPDTANVTVTSEDTIKAATAHDIPTANVEAELPLTITPVNDEPKG